MPAKAVFQPIAVLFAFVAGSIAAVACVETPARADDARDHSPRPTAEVITVAPTGGPIYPPLPPSPIPPEMPEPEPPIVAPLEGGAVCMSEEGAPYVAPRC